MDTETREGQGADRAEPRINDNPDGRYLVAWDPSELEGMKELVERLHKLDTM